MSHLTITRSVATIVLIGTVAFTATDFIRMYVVAGRHLERLESELSRIPPLPGTDRAGVMRTHKSRVASVSERYVGPAPRGHVFDHYRKVLEATGWRQCGHSITHELYCRDEYEVIVSMPSTLGSGSYSLTVQWNRITMSVWLVACTLILLMWISAAALVRPGAAGALTARKGDSVRFRSRSPESECIKRLEAAQIAEVTFRRGPDTSDGMATFGLQKRGGRFTRSVLAPYFYGRLEPDRDTGGTIILGGFGLAPDARAGLVILAVFTLLILAAYFYRDASSAGGVLLVMTVGMLGLALRWWARRHCKREIIDFLKSSLAAENVDRTPRLAGGTDQR